MHWEPASVWVSEGKAHCAIRKQPAWWKHGGPGEEEHSQEEGLSPLTLGLVLAERVTVVENFFLTRCKTDDVIPLSDPPFL